MGRILLLALALSLWAGAAWAYSPHVGDRAADIVGRDAVSDKVVHLSDYAGKWVFIDFWASWCGPCMGELPNMIAVTRPLRSSRSDFAVFSVSLDMPDTDEDLNAVIEKHKIDYPVVYDGNGWSTVQSKEWGINSIPATFLVDPMGNIVATNLRGESLKPALDFFLNHKGVYAPVGVRASSKINDDHSVTLKVNVSNPRHAPVKARLDYYHLKLTYADDDPEHKGRPVKYDYVETNPDKPEQEFTVDTGEFGEGVAEVQIPAVEGAQSVGYDISIELPETESLLGGEGIWVSTGGREKLDAPKPEEPAPAAAAPAVAPATPPVVPPTT